MKKLYSIILFFILTFFISAQSNNGNAATNLTARPIATTTSPTNLINTEVGITEGALNVSLSGSASYTIPILTPPGINGVQPSISINYNSQSGLRGTAAKGWDISGVSSITRIPASKFHDGKIDPVDFNGFDRFALDGQRLIVKNGSTATYGANGTIYETEYFSNIKVTSYGVHPSGANYGPAYFIVEYPNGTKAYYGNSTDSRSVMQWSITNVDNAQGISIGYTYTTTNNSLYIDSIKYGGLTPTTPINEIKFIYGPRAVIEDSYVGGINIRRDKNLTNINVIGNGVGFRNYVFDCPDQLKSVTEKNGDNTKSYNPTIFDYDYSSSSNISYIQGDNILDVGNIRSTNASTVSGDFDGDGNMDFILYPTTGSSAKTKYWLYPDTNPSTPFSASLPPMVGSFDEIFPVSYINFANRLSASQGWTVVNGNSFTTFFLNTTYATIAQNDQKSYTFPRFILDYQYQCNGGGGGGELLQVAQSMQVAQPMGPITPPGPINVHYESDIPRRFISGDFNGDGITDAVAIEKSFGYPYRYMCTSSTSTYQGGKVFFINLDKRVSTNFANVAGFFETTDSSDIRVADFNGDGKADVYVFDSGKVKIYGLNDNLQFNLLFQTSASDANIMLDRPILMGDYNGDGKTDFMVPKAIDSESWYKYTSTGNSLVKEEKSALIFKANDPYNTFNYISLDFNNDGKTDIICEKSNRNTADTLGYITVNCFVSYNGYFSPSPGTASANTLWQADINIYALPVYLPMYHQTLKNGTTSSTLQVAFLNQNKIHFFSSQSDLIKDNLLTNIRTGNGIEEAVTYIPLNTVYKNTSNNIYTPSTTVATYPNFDIQIDPSLYVVSKIEQKSKDVYRRRWFGYYGAVSNVEGLGFLGFRSVTQTNWHDDTAKVFTDIYKNDIDLRGANIETAKVPYLSYPYAGAIPSDFVARSVTTYSSPTENPLQSNKVFKLKTTNVKEFNTLNNTNTEVKNIVYDTDTNITSSTTVSSEASTTIKTVKTDITYETPKTTPSYILGRPDTKTQSVTADGHTMTTTEKYFYNTQELLSSTEKNGIGTSVITESNDYDSYGNITKKTITPALPTLPRITNYQYDTTKRFVYKITDNDNLVTTFEYDLNRLLKKETDPYALTKSYTYDSWFKNLTITDDQLSNVITNTYSRSTEKTIVTTTISAPSLDTSVSEDTFDDLGRKIKSGTKDLNGNFSYVSYLYDIYDRNFKVSEPYLGTSPSQWNEVKFDDYGRNTQSTSFNLRTTSASYPASSLKATLTDGAKSKTTTQNAAGNTISTDETTGGIISYNYFANGNLRKTSYNGIAINIEQDGWGQKTKLIDPSAGTYNYNYNSLGELMTETIDGTGITTSILRDNSGRPTQKTIVGPGTNSETNYTYDGNLPLTIEYIDYNEPAASRKTLTTITYDIYKRILSVVEDKTNVSKFTKSYTYDALDRIVTETKEAKIGTRSSTVKTRNTYKNGDLYQILDDATSKVLWQTNTLNANGQTLESETGNGIKMTNGYDTNGYLSTIKYDKISTSANIITLTTSFDKNTDYLTSRVNSVFGNYTESFKYDDIGRLTEFTNKLGVQETQTYDASGKITGNNLGTYNYDATKAYQNTSVTLTPEATGYYANREGIFNDSMESRNGWSRQPYNPQCISFDNTKAHTGKNSVKINTTGFPGSYVQSDVSILINNPTDTEYTFSGWVYSEGPVSALTLFMLKEGETFYYTNYKTSSTTVTNQWHYINETFLVPANIRNLSLRLDNNGSGNVWYDDVEIRKTSDYANREVIFNDNMESGNGWSRQPYNPQCISFDNTKAHKGENSVKINTTGFPGSYVQSDVSILINNPTDTEYTFSGWVYSEGPVSALTLFMLKEGETFYYTNYKTSSTTVTNQWYYINETFLVPANIRNLSLRLDNNGTGNVWFDDVAISKTSSPASIDRKLIVTYNAFKSPIQIEETSVDKISFIYNADNQRSTMYYGGYQPDKLQRPLRKYYSADGSMEVKENTLTNTFEFVTYIGGDGYSAPIAVKSDGTTQNYLYLHRDYQGTILAVTDANGALVEKRLFDAWGSIIKVQDGAGNYLAGLTVLDRGYTGHEHLQSVGLINMNARLYDPMLHRFLQADNYIQDPTNTQNYNQYGYVLNNPLLYTDPSGNIINGNGNGTGTNEDIANSGYGNAVAAGLQTLKNNWDDWGIKDWANKNISYKAVGDAWNKLWGKNGSNDPTPRPNLSRNVNLQTASFTGIKNSIGSIFDSPSGEQVSLYNSNQGKPINWFPEQKGGPLYNFANKDNTIKKGVVIVYAHATENFIQTNNWEAIHTAKGLDGALKKASPAWRNFRLNGGKMTLVLKACNTGRPNGFAQKISDAFEGLTVIGASNSYYASSFLGLFASYEIGVEYGTWNVYYNNKLINKFKGTK